MKSFVAASALVSVVAAQAPFTAFSLNPKGANPQVNANSGALWLSSPATQSYCPDGVENLDCAALPGNETVFGSVNGALYLDVVVPGGQGVFVGPDGALGFTQAHSAAMPEGSTTTGFKQFTSDESGNPTIVQFNGADFLACPEEEGEKIYVAGASGANGDCIQLQMRTAEAAGTSAWQYE